MTNHQNCIGILFQLKSFDDPKSKSLIIPPVKYCSTTLKVAIRPNGPLIKIFQTNFNIAFSIIYISFLK